MAHGNIKHMGAMSGTTHRTASQWAALDAGIVGLALVLVWLFRFKSVSCPASSSTGCAADARLIPALVASGVLVFMLCVALVLAYLVPIVQRSAAMSGVSLLLVVVGIVAGLLVLFSAGFTVWPFWL